MKELRKEKNVTTVLILLLLAGAALLLIVLFDTNRFVIRRYELISSKVDKPVRFVVLADVHNKQYGKNNEKLVKAVREQKPDAVLAAGDILTAKPGKSLESAKNLMQQVAHDYPVYYALGNHEFRMRLYPETYGNQFQEYIHFLKKQGINVLLNEKTVLPETNIEITGSMIAREYYKRFRRTPMEERYLKKTLPTGNKDKYRVLIAHNPQYFDAYEEWGADLVISGHVHGGIMRLPWAGGVVSPSCTLFPKYDGGIFKKGHASMVLSRGLGTHTIPIRVFNPGELVVITVKPCK